MTREDDFERLFKKSSQAYSEYDDKTAKMIKLLHETRDEQVFIILRLRMSRYLFEKRLSATSIIFLKHILRHTEEQTLLTWANNRVSFYIYKYM